MGKRIFVQFSTKRQSLLCITTEDKTTITIKICMKLIASKNAIHPLKYLIKLKITAAIMEQRHLLIIYNYIIYIKYIYIYIYIYIYNISAFKADRCAYRKRKVFTLCLCIAHTCARLSVYKLYEIIKLFHS